eukprot:5683333-Prymnesium_polylepis.2
MRRRVCVLLHRARLLLHARELALVVWARRITAVLELEQIEHKLLTAPSRCAAGHAAKRQGSARREKRGVGAPRPQRCARPLLAHGTLRLIRRVAPACASLALL